MEILLKILIVLKISLSGSSYIIRIFFLPDVLCSKGYFTFMNLSSVLYVVCYSYLPFVNVCLIFDHCGASFVLLSRSLFILFLFNQLSLYRPI